MAYVNQEKKAKIAAALKPVVPAGWKYSLAVQNGSTIVMTIRQAPVDLIGALYPDTPLDQRPSYSSVNHYHIGNAFPNNPELAEVFKKIVGALNVDNYDNSDIQTDYFDVGHYVSLNVGRWDSPFIDVLPAAEAVHPDDALLAALAAPVKVAKAKSVDRSAYEAYLPSGWADLSPGRKAAATKRAMQLAGVA